VWRGRDKQLKVVENAAHACKALPRLMDAMTRFGSTSQLGRRRRQAIAAGLVSGMGILAACGGASPSPQSNAQIAANDLNAGLAVQAAGNLTQAASDYKSAIADDGQNKYAYYDLGLVEELMGQPAASEVNYRATIQLDPTFVPALFNLAILRTAPSPFEAEELYRQVIGLAPKDATAYLNLGFLLRSQGDVTEGDMDLHTAVLLDPSLASRIPPGTLATPKPAASSPRP
jgi:tetratricopeptide (TPR) repeat protein